MRLAEMKSQIRFGNDAMESTLIIDSVTEVAYFVYCCKTQN